MSKNVSERPTKSRSTSNSPLPERRKSEPADSSSRFQKAQELKERHAENHARRTGNTDEVPRLFSPTICSLYKRESFRKPNNRRRCRSVDYLAGQHCPLSSDGEDTTTQRTLRAMTAEPGMALLPPPDELDDFESDEDDQLDRSFNVEKMRQDMERICDEVFPVFASSERHLFDGRNRVKGGLSPLPPRGRNDFLDEDDDVALDKRAHSAGDVIPTRHSQESSGRSDIFFPQPVLPASQLPLQEPQVNFDLNQGGQVEHGVLESSGLQGHPFHVEASSGFENTDGMLNSQEDRPISQSSHMDSDSTSIPGTQAKHQETSVDRSLVSPRTLDVSNGSALEDCMERSKTVSEMRIKSDSVIKEGPPSRGCVCITDELGFDRRRSYSTREKPQIVRSLIWASVFAGLAAVVGTFFSKKS